MTISIASTPDVLPSGGMPSAPQRTRKVRMTFLAGDTYPTGGFDITVALAAAFPGEQVVAGPMNITLAGSTVRLAQVVPGTAVKVFMVEESSGTMRQVPNATNLVAHSPMDLTIHTQ